MSELMLDVGQACEIKAALRREGRGERQWTNEKIKILCEKKGLLSQVLDVLNGFSEIKPIEHVIDCDVDPSIPDGWSIEEHIKGGVFHWVAGEVSLYLSKRQENGKVIGHDLRKELEKQPVMNACVGDYLLEHRFLIPESWKWKAVFFWGTIYRDAGGNLCVRHLYWIGDRWTWICTWLGDNWFSNFPAAVRSK